MKKINFYIFKLTIKYIAANILFIGILVSFINLLEISRIIDSENQEIKKYIFLSFLKIPSIISETIPFAIIISIAFLFKNLISNNELISIRNVGFSILDVFKPISLAIFIFGFIILLLINPLSAKFERQYDLITSKDFSDLYSIKLIDEGMWIKNISSNNKKNFISALKINLDNMEVKDIKILNITKNSNKIIMAKNGKIKDKQIELIDVNIFNLTNNQIQKIEKYNLNVNFDRNSIIDTISNYKFIPFYKYNSHIKNLKKFNLHSPEVSLYYLSEILKPFFLVTIAFAVMGYSGKFKRNENFFKILFIAMLIGFLIFLFKEIMITLTSTLSLSYIFSYSIIFIFPIILGFYQIIKIETD